jgi:hypothetical protein
MDSIDVKNLLDINKTLIWFLIFIMFIILLFLIITNLLPDVSQLEHMINVPNIDSSETATWARTESCKYYMDDTTSKVLEISNINKAFDHTKAQLIFPCGYNNIDDEIKGLPNVYQQTISESESIPKRIFIIEGADEITAKNYLWKNILNHHGLTKARSMSPNTYLLTDPEKDLDLKRLVSDHYPDKLYIMKKNVQRQTGLEITDDIEKIKRNLGYYVLAQEVVQDSYLVSGRKINLRVYIVVVCHEARSDIYMFNNGFMYYTKKPFVKGDKTPDNHITTGYVERDVYHKNPLTHDDFKKYLDMNENEKYHESNDGKKLSDIEKNIKSQGLLVSNVVFDRIEKLIGEIFIAFKGRICRKISDTGELIPIYKDYSVQIFGADIAINDQLQPQIIEINKGPDLSPKDDRDGSVKIKLVSDVLEVIGIRPKKQDNGLRLVLEM